MPEVLEMGLPLMFSPPPPFTGLLRSIMIIAKVCIKYISPPYYTFNEDLVVIMCNVIT